MIKYVFLITILLFGGCSFKSEPNEWAYKSSNAFGSYTKNFLMGNDLVAKNDLKRAVTHAKSSADLTQLARIYLGVCALNMSVGIDDKCKTYTDMSDVAPAKFLRSYYELMQGTISEKEVESLDEKYQHFALSIINKNYAQAKKDIFDTTNISSKLLGASLLKEELTFDEVQKIIDAASFYGYKKSVIYWLKIQKTKTNDINTMRLIEKKVKILES